MKTVIIGAGPAGLYTAYLLARAGKEVEVIEEHKRIGLPVHCTGIVTSHIKEFAELKEEFIANTINKVRVFSKTNFLELNLKNPNYILNREKFELHLAELAESSGAKISLGETYIGNSDKKVFTNKGVIDFDFLIGADGPLSPVAKTNNMIPARFFWHGIQARIRVKNDNAVEFYPNIGACAWIVPESRDVSRVGLFSENNAKSLFDDFLKAKGFEKKDIIDYQSGLIPRFNPNQTVQKKNIFLVGDAAGQVKATTGGGIVPGLSAARALADCIINGKSYEPGLRWTKKELKKHLLIRRVINKFGEEEWKRLLNLLKKESARKLIEEYDREYPSRFRIKLLLSQPRLSYFIKYLF